MDFVTGPTLRSELIRLASEFEEKYANYPILPTDANESDPVKVLTHDITLSGILICVQLREYHKAHALSAMYHRSITR